MSQQKEIDLTLVDNNDKQSGHQLLLTQDDGKNVIIQCLDGPLKGKVYSGVDYFWILGDLRNDLYESGLRPLVKGAIKNVFPGGMAGETSLGLIAYIIDEQGKGMGSVNIFEQVEIDESNSIVSFEEQKAYRKQLTQKRRSRSV